MAAATQATPFTPEDDTLHTLSDDPYETETNWWSFNVPERKIGCWVHAGVRPNKKAVTWRIFVWDDKAADPLRLAYYKKVEDAPVPERADLRDITFANGGYHLKMLKPLMDYSVTYKDAEQGFALEMEHRSVHPPRRFMPGEPPAMHNPHLDQLGWITGTMTLRGERIPLKSLSVRDRTWGPRVNHPTVDGKLGEKKREYRVLHPGGAKWREIERQRGRNRIQYIFGHADEKTGFLSFVRPQDGDAKGWSPMNYGWILRDGVFANIDKTKSRMLNFRDPETGWSQHMLVDATDETGRRMEAEGFAVSYMCEHGAGANALMRWEFDGKIGWGEDQDGWRADHFVLLMNALRATR